MLHEIQAKVKAPKGQFNNFGGYKYRSCEDIVEAVKPIVNKMGYSLILTDELVNIGARYYVKATATLTDGKTFYSAVGYAREEETKKGMDSSQITGAASSYARKYALNGLFAIDDTKDADATNDHGKNDPVPSSPKKPKLSSKQFSILCERVSSGDTDAYNKAKQIFDVSQEQSATLEIYISKNNNQ